MHRASSRFPRPAVLLLAALGIVAALAVGLLARTGDGSEPALAELGARVAELERENARLRSRLAESRGHASRSELRPDRRRPGDAVSAAPPSEHAGQAAPETAAGWLERVRALRDAGAEEEELRALRDDFEAWLEQDPDHLLAVIAGLGEGDDLGSDLLDLLPEFVQGNADAQAALVDLFTSHAVPEDARARALAVYGRTLRRDALAAGRFAEADREVVRDLARSGSGELRDAALSALSRLVDDPASIDALAGAWNDPDLSPAGMQFALRGLRHAEPGVATPILLEAVSGDYDPEVRWTAARGLAFLGPEEGGESLFRTLEPILPQEDDWRVKGLALVAMYKFDSDRTRRLVEDLGSLEVDAWEQQRYLAMADALDSKGDWVTGLHTATRALDRINARQAEQQGLPTPEPMFRRGPRRRSQH